MELDIMYQGVGMLSFNSYSLINIRFLINKGGVIMSHQDKKSLIGQADARLQKMTQAGVGRSKHQDKIDDIDHKNTFILGRRIGRTSNIVVIS